MNVSRISSFGVMPNANAQFKSSKAVSTPSFAGKSWSESITPSTTALFKKLTKGVEEELSPKEQAEFGEDELTLHPKLRQAFEKVSPEVIEAIPFKTYMSVNDTYSKSIRDDREAMEKHILNMEDEVGLDVIQKLASNSQKCGHTRGIFYDLICETKPRTHKATVDFAKNYSKEWKS